MATTPTRAWVRLSGGSAGSLEVVGATTIGFSAIRYTANDLYAAHHTVDLQPRRTTVLSLDHAQRGLGTASCGPDTAVRHRLLERSYRFGYMTSVR